VQPQRASTRSVDGRESVAQEPPLREWETDREHRPACRFLAPSFDVTVEGRARGFLAEYLTGTRDEGTASDELRDLGSTIRFRQ
jgi:hypothetical protein